MRDEVVFDEVLEELKKRRHFTLLEVEELVFEKAGMKKRIVLGSFFEWCHAQGIRFSISF